MIDAEELFEKYLNLDDAEDYGCVGKYNDDVEKLLISFADEINSMVCENCKWSGDCTLEETVLAEFDFKNFGCTEFEIKTHIDT